MHAKPMCNAIQLSKPCIVIIPEAIAKQQGPSE